MHAALDTIWANISAIPIADLAADLTVWVCDIHPANSRGASSRIINPGCSKTGANFKLHCNGARSPVPTSTSFTKSGVECSRAR